MGTRTGTREVPRGFAAFAVAIYLSGSMAATAQQTMILSYGSDDCDRFSRAPNREKKEYIVWVEGFMTGLNLSATGNKRMTGLFWNQSSRSAWLEDWCGKHPRSAFVQAATALRVSLGGQTLK